MKWLVRKERMDDWFGHPTADHRTRSKAYTTCCASRIRGVLPIIIVRPVDYFSGMSTSHHIPMSANSAGVKSKMIVSGPRIVDSRRYRSFPRYWLFCQGSSRSHYIHVVYCWWDRFNIRIIWRSLDRFCVGALKPVHRPLILHGFTYRQPDKQAGGVTIFYLLSIDKDLCVFISACSS